MGVHHGAQQLFVCLVGWLLGQVFLIFCLFSEVVYLITVLESRSQRLETMAALLKKKVYRQVGACRTEREHLPTAAYHS